MVSSRSPDFCTVSTNAGRPIIVTGTPERASSPPKYPPTAPAPTTATFGQFVSALIRKSPAPAYRFPPRNYRDGWRCGCCPLAGWPAILLFSCARTSRLSVPDCGLRNIRTDRGGPPPAGWSIRNDLSGDSETIGSLVHDYGPQPSPHRLLAGNSTKRPIRKD